VIAGQPKTENEYEKFTVDSLDVYVPKKVKTENGEIKIDLAGKSIFSRLVINGIIV